MSKSANSTTARPNTCLSLDCDESVVNLSTCAVRVSKSWFVVIGTYS